MEPIENDRTAQWPPAGLLDRDGVCRMFGIRPGTIGLWYRTGRLRCGTWVGRPGGKPCKVYPLAELQRLADEMAAADRAGIPEGFVDRDGTRRMFGVCLVSLRNWELAGKIRCGQWTRMGAKNRRRKLYPIEDLRLLVQAMRGPAAVYRTSDLRMHVPDGFVNADQAGRLFGVNKAVLTRWEREGQITCAQRHTAQGVRVYPLAALERLVAECGTYSPPYPDPDRPGVYRVPLGGHDMRRREAIIDAADAPLLEGNRFHFSLEDGSPEHHGRVMVANTRIRLHQLVLGLSGNEWKVGHLNGDPLDCRRSNLIVRTHSECGAAMRRRGRSVGGCARRGLRACAGTKGAGSGKRILRRTR